MKIKYLGHSAFLIKTQNQGILIDPFVNFSQEFRDLNNFRNENIQAIFVTHAHSDHIGSALEIAKITGAPVVSVFELGNYCLSKGVNAIPAGLGGKLNFSFFSATLVPSQHTSSLNNGQYMGVACGVVLEIEGKKIYHCGDTSLTSEMNIIADYYKPDVSMLPVGGHFTMGIEEACFASEILGSKIIIPMHYNTFPPIKVDINDFVNKISKNGKIPKVLNIDEEFEL